MALPLQKRKNKFTFSLSHELYSVSGVEKSLQDFKSASRKVYSSRNGRIKFDLDFKDLNSALEFGNYLLSRCR